AGLGAARRVGRGCLPGRAGRGRGDRPQDRPGLPARRGQRGGVRRAVRRVPDPARLLRPRRQRRAAPAARHPRAGGAAARGRPPVTAAAPAGVLTALREELDELHRRLVSSGLVAWTSGNVSARVPGTELMLIKPSGVEYQDLTPESMVLCDLDGRPAAGAGGAGAGGSGLSPSSDTAAHAYVYRHMPEVGGVVHTHSAYATAWAARGEPVPCVLTAIADEFGG